MADGVWVRQSEWVWANSIVVRGEEGLIVVDPGIHGAELERLADDIDGLGVPVVAGFSTHPHFDHLLWHSRFGDVPRYAAPTCAQIATEARERARAMAAESAEDVALVTAPSPKGPRSPPASPPTAPTSTPCGEERSPPTRGSARTPIGKARVLTARTWSRPGPGSAPWPGSRCRPQVPYGGLQVDSADRAVTPSSSVF